MRHESYQSFWPFYLQEHAKPQTRTLHYVGTALTIAVAGWALIAGTVLLLLLIPVVGYGFAWTSHAFVERNKPATFTYPLWSLISDYRMFWLEMAGQLEPELEKAGITSAPLPAPQPSATQ
ncbi:MAG: DUF962 domain-containing protein [Pseudomonadota bacterium]